MPEGPEIHREADKLHRVLAGEVARDVFFAFETLAEEARELTGRTVESVTARGKALLTRFEGDRIVYSHNQLYGRWYVKKAGELPTTNRQLRFAVHTDAKSALLYSASDIEVLSSDGLETQPYLARLGPDVLAGLQNGKTGFDEPMLEASEVAERLVSDRFRRRSLGLLLLDQGFLGGLGNYLRSEILWLARVHPSARAKDLDAVTVDALAEALLALPRRSYETGGVTSDPERVAALKAKGARRPRWRFNVFAQASRPCPRCRKKIEKTRAGGRRLYLCPRCQTPPPGRG